MADVEPVALRWYCMWCEATVIGTPDRLPTGWVEIRRPPWTVHFGPRFACPEHAVEAQKTSSNQWARFEGRVCQVDAAEFEAFRRQLQALAGQLMALRQSGK